MDPRDRMHILELIIELEIRLFAPALSIPYFPPNIKSKVSKPVEQKRAKMSTTTTKD